LIDLNMTLVAQIVNFLVLAFLLKKFAYQPLLGVLKERQDQIQDRLDKADRDAAAAENTLKEYKAQLADARTKAQDILDSANKRAEEEREAKVLETKHEIEQMKKTAKLEIERDRERAEEQVKSQVIALSMAAAGKVLAKNLDTEANEALVADFVDKIDKDKIGDLPC
jgi:F-type H+-transporting ATPase subunit b